MKNITVNAYAKVNFALKILGKMPNGYHRIESFMQSTGLCDTVSVAWKKTDGSCAAKDSPKTGEQSSAINGQQEPRLSVSLDPGRSDLPSDSGNLAYRAAEAMHAEFHRNVCEKIDIKIEKRIPVAAGLAGGSADCAAVIAALAGLWELAEISYNKKDGGPDPRRSIVFSADENTLDRLVSVAASLGSDIPFCLMNHFGAAAAIATGTGTEIKKTEGIECTLVMITPAVNVSTKAVYGELKPSDYLNTGAERTETGFSQGISAAGICEAKDLSEKIRYMGNDLAAPALRLFPNISETLGVLSALSQKPLYVQLSGSGPTCFAIYGPGTKPDFSRLSEYADRCGAFLTVCDTRM